MGRGVKIPWVRKVKIRWIGGQNTMDMGFDIPWVVVFKLSWVGVKIPWLGVQQNMSRGVKYHV